MESLFSMRPLRLLGFLALGLALLAATGCVSQEEQKRLQAAFDQSRQQLAEADQDRDNLRKQDYFARYGPEQGLLRLAQDYPNPNA